MLEDARPWWPDWRHLIRPLCSPVCLTASFFIFILFLLCILQFVNFTFSSLFRLGITALPSNFWLKSKKLTLHLDEKSRLLCRYSTLQPVKVSLTAWKRGNRICCLSAAQRSARRERGAESAGRRGLHATFQQAFKNKTSWLSSCSVF